MKFWISLFGCLALVVFLCLGPADSTIRHSLRCLNCTKASHYIECKDMVTCDPFTHVCYVEEETDLGGELVVNAGCRRKEECDRAGCFGDVARRRKRDVFGGRDVTCHHCCDGDFCNMYGCPENYNATTSAVTRCFVCSHVSETGLCTTIHNCGKDQICLQEELRTAVGNKFDLKCANKRLCAMLRQIKNNNNDDVDIARKKRDVKLSADCCENDLCNGLTPMATAPPSSHSATYKCPKREDVPTHRPEEISTVTEVTCRDTDLQCEMYGYTKICSEPYLVWSREHCAKYCGFCPEGLPMFLQSETSDVPYKGQTGSALMVVPCMMLLCLMLLALNCLLVHDL